MAIKKRTRSLKPEESPITSSAASEQYIQQESYSWPAVIMGLLILLSFLILGFLLAFLLLYPFHSDTTDLSSVPQVSSFSQDERLAFFQQSCTKVSKTLTYFNRPPHFAGITFDPKGKNILRFKHTKKLIQQDVYDYEDSKKEM